MPIYAGTKELVKVYRGILPFCKIYNGSVLKHWASDCRACVKYGYLYNRYAVTDAKYLAASGWHIPTDAEWTALSDYLGTKIDDYDNPYGYKLKETGTTYWDSPNTGATNEVGFYGRGGGVRYKPVSSYIYDDINQYGYFWSSTQNYGVYYWARQLYYNSVNIHRGYADSGNGYSVRLIKDDSTLAGYTGNDGKTYSTVKINDQVWLAENLAETEYRDHSKIIIVEDATVWAGLSTGAMCAYDNDYTNVGCGETEPEIYDAFLIKILLSESTEITLPLLENGETFGLDDEYLYDFIVDWGDGNSGTVTSFDDTNAIHTYSSSGEYSICIMGKCQCFSMVNGEGYFDIQNYIIKVIQWGNCDFRLLNFYGCANLTEIPNGAITGANEITTFMGGFGITGLTVIPEGLFDNCKNVISFAICFFECDGITTVPASLFKDQQYAVDFTMCFMNCNNIESIPADLFDGCSSAENFSYCFNYNNKLNAIPESLFDDCPLAIDFSYTFHCCKTITEIPDGLFNNMIAATTFVGTFALCNNLVTFPVDLFDNCLSATSFRSCFSGSSNIDGNAPELWNDYPDANGTNCFYACTGLDNYDDIPVDWK